MGKQRGGSRKSRAAKATKKRSRTGGWGGNKLGLSGPNRRTASQYNARVEKEYNWQAEVKAQQRDSAAYDKRRRGVR